MRKKQKKQTKHKTHKGRTRIGLYPHVSRTDLAQLTNLAVSTVAGILRGRTECSLANAIIISDFAGVTLKTFHADWRRAREERQRAEQAQ
jgi:hypothetical protein